ncbi:hypothetical protein [Thetidibacter halocola]|uniref:Uncharacterized protein n=1 Tax=Thetidibacter halocola TaxID=2827239 RepID=A0A8J7WAF2_9RHOB|nr:hypothetical protein [Thetidibacter halocola]MBS0122894.1 hypothetical protein [Thetidibacter halocola]
MNSLFQPDPVVIGFLFARKFLWLEMLALLALARAIGGPGKARALALGALALCLAGIATTFSPALGLNGGPLYASAAQVMAQGGGMLAALVPSAVLVASGLVRDARWRWIDVVHGVALVAFLWVWWWIS